MKRKTVSERALVLAPRGRDAAVAVAMLGEAGIASEACASLPHLVGELDRGAGFVVATEEALATADLAPLSAWIAEQEEWSDLPFVLLTIHGGGLERNPAAKRYLDVLGNATFLERPFHPTTLASLARSALRGRRRQYEARARLEALRESEARFEAIANSIDQMIWSTRPDGFHDYFNDRWYEYTGAPHGSTDGAAWNGMFHPDDQDRAWRVWRRCLETGEPYHIEYRLRHRSGQYRWVIGRAQCVRDADGRITRWFGTCTDVHDLKEAEAALRESEARLRALTDNLPAGMIYQLAMNPDGGDRRFVYVSRSCERVTGVAAEAALADAMALYGVIEPDRRAGLAAAEAEAIANLAPFDERVPFRKGGELRWSRIVSAPRRLADGSLLWDGMFIDVTENKRAEDGLRESEARLRFLSELDEALRESRDAPAAMLAAAGLLARRLGASRCAYADVDADNDRFVIRSDYTAPGVASSAGTYSLALFGPRASADMRGGRTLIVRDVAGELAPDEGREMFQSIGIDAIVCCPLVKDGRLVAMMAVHQDRPRDWRGDEIGLVETVVERCWAHVERVGAEARLRETSRRLDAILNNTREAVFLMDHNQHCVYANAAAEKLTGYPFAEMQGRPLHDVVHHKRPDGSHYPLEECPIDRAFPERAQMQGEELFVAPDGSFYPVAFTASPLLDEMGKPVGTVIEARNIAGEKARDAALRELNENLERRVEEEVAERAKAEEALRQAQKMEAVGQLTGGIAHDFNNLLTGIIGSLDLLQRRVAQGRTGEIERFVSAATASANRAAALTHRLLAFSRRQPLDPKPVDANRLVTSMEELLRRTLGEAYEIEIVTAGGLWQTKCDPHQLESALLNLAINARDAMPDGGKLTVETCNAHLDNAYVAQTREVRPGQYICICVSDTGSGMSKETIEKAFDPFFTTKPIGQGTGLGLSMVYGFARQSEGYAKIYSEVGQGTTVKLYLPRFYGNGGNSEEAARATELPVARAEHGEVVLVVEDEPAVRGLVTEVLADLGYHALEAADGPSGLKILESGRRIDLLVTDVGLPGLNGRQLADAARAKRPGLKVLFMTGYAENAAINSGFLEPGMELITKPFPIDALTQRIRAMIEKG